MCGIAGLCKRGSSPRELLKVVSDMCRLIKHRGPDDEGYVIIGDRCIPLAGVDTPSAVKESNFSYSPCDDSLLTTCKDATVALGHRRLAVIDLTPAGHQPFSNRDGSVWVVFNGEIYNYIELRDELINLGCSFSSKSDTEVLMQAYEQWGTSCIAKFNGMWSFALYDTRKRTLWVSRDRFGVKPLYYWHTSTSFAFASEHKAFYAIPGFKPSINSQAVFDYFIMHQVENQSEGFLNDIIELNPGCEMFYSIETNELKIQKYYNLQVNNSLERFDKRENQDHIAHVRDLVQNAVRIRLRSDIPVGFCLSGGIDSSTLVSCSDLLRNKGLWDKKGAMFAFTAVNGVEGFDEICWARKVAQKSGCKLIEAPCTEIDLMLKLREMIQFQDVPLLSTSTYAQYRVMEVAAQEGIHLLLDGQGADELFGGYAFFIPSYYNGLLRNGDFINLYRQLLLHPKELTSFSSLLFVQAKRCVDWMIPDLVNVHLASFLRPEIQYLERNFWKKERRNFSFESERFENDLNKQLAQFYNGKYLKALLRFEDRCSMRFSIESRTPFSDDLPLIEYLFSVPSPYKINGGYTKSLLRESMRGILPDEVRLRRDKLGFSTPQTEWMCRLNDQLRQIISGVDREDDFIQYRSLAKDWNKIFAPEVLRKHPGNATFLWRCLNFIIWKELFIP